jgi:Ser/Thr protein kinase RdoA (MazF antagonist)
VDKAQFHLQEIGTSDDPWLQLVVALRGDLVRGAVAAVNDARSVNHPWVQETLLVHGDFHPGNLLFRQDLLCAILDFEYAHMECAAYDLGYAALFFATRWGNETPGVNDQVDGTLDMTLLEPLLEGYTEQWAQNHCLAGGQDRPSIPQALEIIRPYMRIAGYLVIYWLLKKYVEQPDERLLLRRAIDHNLKALNAMS